MIGAQLVSLPGYSSRSVIAETQGSVILRAIRESDGRPVVLKTPRYAPTPEQVARLEREYNLTRSLQSLDGVIEAIDFVARENTCVIVTEDIGGVSLDLITEPLDLHECLQAFIQVADTLGRIHARRVIHKDVNPSNLVWNRQTRLARVIDFGLATELTRETPAALNLSVLQGTLGYISPEQTGRMNRSIDYRTDLYSAGATLYRMLTGRAPFAAGDAMELVHAHMARVPLAPHEVCSTVPEILSRITLKLMAKRAEERYQNAFALRDDLQECLNRLTTTGSIEPFPIAAGDVSDRFQIPQRLYGREAEIATLLAAFERTSGGSKEMVLVAGYSGIGKSALVHEVQKPIVKARGAFISGKFDQLSRNIPYASLIQAFQELVRQLLAEPAERLALWKEKLLAALGPNAQVIIEVLSEVELIVGKQPSLPALPAAEAQNRFDFAVESFVRTFAGEDHPLVLFLDDLQWADGPSLRLIETLTADAKTSHLLLIGAYRDNEVDPSHPLMLSLSELRKRGIPIQTVALAPLNFEDCQNLIADAVHVNPAAHARPLAEVCMRKTGGNPFFLNQFLRSLYEYGSISFNPNERRWMWNIEAIGKSDMTENVVEMMARKIHAMPKRTHSALTTAACIGNTFDLATLAIASGNTPRQIADDLWESLKEELVLPVGDDYKFFDKVVTIASSDEAAGESVVEFAARKVVYRFLHDRVQQAAYSLLNSSEKQQLHLSIGRSLLERYAGEERSEKLFSIANHLNLGSALLIAQAERDELGALNLEVARKAKASAAHATALAYLKHGIELLGPESFKRKYDLALALHVEAADACQLLSDFEEMERHAAIALSRVKTVLEKVKVYETRYQAFVAQRRFADALAAAREVLALLGEPFPRSPGKPLIMFDLLRTKTALAGKTTENLVGLASMTDPVKLAAMRILARACSAAYIASPELFPLIVFRMIRLSVKYGNTAASAYGYAVYGIILCGVVGDIDGAYRFGKLSLAILEHHDAAEYEARTRFISAAHLGHWKDPVRQRLDSFRAIYQRALDTGDLEFAAWALMIRSMHNFFVGTPLREAAQEAGYYIDALADLKHDSGKEYVKAVLQMEHCLMGQGKASSPWRLQGAEFDDVLMLPVHHKANDLFGVCNVHLYSLLLCYWFGRHQEGLEHAREAEKYLDTVAALLQVPVFFFYDSLNRLVLAGRSPSRERRTHLRKVAANQRKMKNWARHAPRNHLHRYTLVEAERARVAGRDAAARELYRRAAALAHENEYPHEEGLSHELHARFWETNDEIELVHIPLSRARDLYARWGAASKVDELDRKLRPLLAASPRLGADLGGTLAAGDTMTIQAATASLDLESVLKASQAISGEMVLTDLLAKMIRILIQNAGAEIGFLLLERGGELRIEAEGSVYNEEVSVLRSVPLDVRAPLSIGVVNYVIRTGKSVILDDAARDSRFEGDAYLEERQPKSLLCLPIVNKGQLRGIIYMENNLATGAFTVDRVKTLSMLSGQIAISIDNAELVAGLEQKVEERTKSLREENERAEAALAEAERARGKAEEANRAKSLFLANMSHELRTPLSAVLGFAQLMGRRPGRDTEDIEQLAIIGRAGEHLLGLINDVLSLSKIEAGQVTLAPSSFDLVSMIRGLTDMLRVRAEAKGLELVFAPAGELPSFVLGDESRIRQVLLNLLGNAVKFTEQGHVILRASWREGKVRFDVEDTGPGMTSDEIASLFQPFVQTATGQKSKEGTGLGLVISRNFARVMGGDITVVSEPGKGTTFTVTVELPQAREGEVVAVRERGDRRSVVGLVAGQPIFRILVVDDVLENRLLLSKLLGWVGFEVREAMNGEQAIEHWRNWRPHLIFMDLRMPVMDGLTATRRIRAEEKDGPERVKIVILSASAMEHERESINTSGCDDFLTKPFREQAVFGKVAEQLGVRFEYEMGSQGEEKALSLEVLTPARLAALPVSLRVALANALGKGDDEQAKVAAEVIRARDAPLADTLKKTLDQCQFDELLRMLEQVNS